MLSIFSSIIPSRNPVVSGTGKLALCVITIAATVMALSYDANEHSEEEVSSDLLFGITDCEDLFVNQVEEEEGNNFKLFI